MSKKSIRTELKNHIKNVPKDIYDEVFRLNFYRAHLAYFLVCILISSVIFYGDTRTQHGAGRLDFTDVLFLCTSAITSTGLNTVDLNVLTGFQQAILCILIILGNVAFVSIFIVAIRRYWFQKKLTDLVKHSKSGKKLLHDIDADRPKPKHHQPQTPRRVQRHSRGGFPNPWRIQRLQIWRYPPKLFSTPAHETPHKYISFQPNLDHKGRIYSLDEDERDELGGVEYRALNALLWLLPAYLLFWLVMGTIFIVPYAYRHSLATIIRTSQTGNLSPGWWGFFIVVSSYGNCGLNLLSANFVPLRGYYYLLIFVGILNLAGNTQFPIFLRCTIWCISKLLPESSRLHHDLLFLLHHPRRCFIYLFPSYQSWELFTIQVLIDLTGWVLFEILNLGIIDIMAIPPGERTIDGLFQSLGLRTGGFYITNIGNLAPACLIAFLSIMYISNFPIIMALRQSNIYEEKSIGLDTTDDEAGGGSTTSHLQSQISYDLWFLIFSWFLIATIERANLTSLHPGVTPFTLLFETTSAYGTVGLSTGIPYATPSLSGILKKGSKLVLMAVMLRGRHRGLPLAIDRSIMIPGSEELKKMDDYYNRYGEVDKKAEKEVRRDEEESGQGQSKEGGHAKEEQNPELRRRATSGKKKSKDGGSKDSNGDDDESDGASNVDKSNDKDHDDTSNTRRKRDTTAHKNSEDDNDDNS